jgi:hypothetical protein
MVLLFAFVSSLFMVLSFMSTKRQAYEWSARIVSIALIPVTLLTVSEVFTPWILQLPFHYCPFCLVARSLASIPFVLLYWFGISASWWTALTKTLARKDSESIAFETELRAGLWKASSASVFIGLLVIAVNVLVSFA